LLYSLNYLLIYGFTNFTRIQYKTIPMVVITTEIVFNIFIV